MGGFFDRAYPIQTTQLCKTFRTRSRTFKIQKTDEDGQLLGPSNRVVFYDERFSQVNMKDENHYSKV